MADAASYSQVQQALTEEWKKLVASQVATFGSVLGEIAKLESQGATQVVVGIEEAGRHAREALAAAGRASAEWRRLAIEASRRAADLVAP